MSYYAITKNYGQYKLDKICNETTCTGMSTMLNFLFFTFTFILYHIIVFNIQAPRGPLFW